MDLYEILGIQRDASLEDIKKAHKDKVKEHHPDKGGDAAIFKLVQEAYEILSDPEFRSKYDRGDRIDGIRNNIENQILGTVSQVFMHVVSHVDLKHTSIFDEMRSVLGNSRTEIAQHIKKIDNAIDRFIEAKKRIGGAKDSLFKQMLDNTIAATEAQKRALLDKDHVLEKSIEFIKDCNYDIEKILQIGNTGDTGFSYTFTTSTGF